ncbi:MAG: hypothetical protein ACYDHZ_00720 [Dehalococcoidia bacterium]
MKIPQSGLYTDNPAFPLLQDIISYQGVTTANGVPAGTTFVCADLANQPSYLNYAVKILGGPSAGQIKAITIEAGGGVRTVDSAFTNATGGAQQITAGTPFVILSINLSGIMQILAIVTSIAGGSYWQTFGPSQVQVTNAVSIGVSVYDPGGGIIPLADITPGTYTIDRIRLGVLTNIVGATPSSKVDGAVYINYAFPGASWAIGDLAVVTFTGIQITISGVTTSLPPIQFWTRVVMEPDIDTIVNTINTVQGTEADAATLDDLSDVTTTTTEAKLRRILLRLAPAAFTATIQGAARTDLAAMVASLATYFKAAGAAFSSTIQGSARTDVNAAFDGIAAYFVAAGAALSVTIDPGGAARTSMGTLWNDLGQMLAGASGLTTFPAATAAANGVSIAKVIRYIQETCLGYEGATSLAAKLTAVRAGYLDALNTGVPVNSRTTAFYRLAGSPQTFTKNITSAANAGDVNIATITTQTCLIKRIIVRANAAITANLTSIAVFGGAGKVVTFIDAATGVRANIAATDQQVFSTDPASLPATKTIVITLTGTGATAVNLQVDIEYESIVDGGYLT